MVAFAYIAFAVLAVANAQCPLSFSGCAPGAPVFRVALDNCGPAPLPLPVQSLQPQVTPVIEKPVIALPAAIPAPRTINNVCSCVKTIVKPQVYQQQIAVPSVQRYLETSHTPVVENIVYNAVPINCPPIAPEYPGILGGIAPYGVPALPAGLPALPAVLPALSGCGPIVPSCGPIVPPCY